MAFYFTWPQKWRNGFRTATFCFSKPQSQADIEKRIGLQSFYISRVENGHNVPAIETLEKMARALEVRIYALFYDGEKPPADLPKPNETTAGSGSFGRDARTLDKFRRLLSQMDKADMNLLLLHGSENGQKERGFEKEAKR